MFLKKARNKQKNQVKEVLEETSLGWIITEEKFGVGIYQRNRNLARVS